ncbi:unnamed protein product [Allacma fusca]|uniref:Ig-like domain-containing protein n=1 Tax=Allacma fusca TaxID=39272 RepID=A0A8J2K8J2_9HEXA|nr:unnamed protein product [Allacma fusca]
MAKTRNIFKFDDVCYNELTAPRKPIDINYLNVGATNQSCVSEWKNDGSEKVSVSLSCNGSNVVPMHLSLNTTFEAVDMKVTCTSFGFPLDLNAEKLFPGKWIRYQNQIPKGETHSFIVEFGGRESFYSKSLEGKSFSNNYTFYSVGKPELNLTIDLRIIFAPLHPDAVKPELTLELTSFKVTCNSHNNAHNVYMINSAGNNPTMTNFLRPCLQSKRFGCSDNLRHGYENRWQYAKSELVDFLPQGLIYCYSGDQEVFLEYFTSVQGYTVFSNMSRMWEDKNVIFIQKYDELSTYLVNETSASNNPTENNMTIYESEPVTFECHFLRYFLKPLITWSIEFEDGRRAVVYHDVNIKSEEKYWTKEEFSWNAKPPIRKSITVASSYCQGKGTKKMVAVHCSAEYWNYKKTATASLSIITKPFSESEVPGFNVNESIQLTSVGSFLQLNCSADYGTPEPVYTWSFVKNSTVYNQTNYTVIEERYNHKLTSVLIIDAVTVDMEGEYICSAKNFRGIGELRFEVEVLHNDIGGQSNNRHFWLYLGASWGIIAVFGVISGKLLRICCKKSCGPSIGLARKD